MNREINTIFTIAMVGLVSIMSFSYWNIHNKNIEEKDAVEIALNYLKKSPTYSFDGISESINVKSVDILESYPVQYVVTIYFECRHAGYGDRTGQILAQVITPHLARVTIVEGEIMSAWIDDEWDIINQRERVVSELLPPEYARDHAINYILEKYDLELPIPDEWELMILTPEGIVGSSIQQYSGDGWVVNVSFAVVAKPDYTLSIKYSGEYNFTWKGELDQTGNIDEISTSLVLTILTQEDARDIAIQYIIDNNEKFRNIEAPTEWTTTDLTPKNLIGYVSQQFKGDGWTVNVSNPVVWKPTYKLEIEYIGDFKFNWIGEVYQAGNVTEIN